MVLGQCERDKFVEIQVKDNKNVKMISSHSYINAKKGQMHLQVIYLSGDLVTEWFWSLKILSRVYSYQTNT